MNTPVIKPALYLHLQPYAISLANLQFAALHLKPCRPDSFLCLALGPSTNDVHAIAVLDMSDEAGEFEIVQAIALSDDAYRALCKAIECTMKPLGIEKITGMVGMVSMIQPMRVYEMRPYVEAATLFMPEGSVN